MPPQPPQPAPPDTRRPAPYVPPRLGLLAGLVIGNVVLSFAFQDALFLAHHDRAAIPLAMLFGSLITAATTLAVGRLLRRASQAAALRAILLGLGAVSAAFAVFLARRDAGPRSTFALFLFVELSTTLGVAATWGYFQAPLDAAQIRRLMPRLGVCAGIGGLAAGALIPLCGGPPRLVAASALGWTAAAILVWGHAVPVRAAGPHRHERMGLRQVLRLPLARWMMLGTGGILWMGLLIQYETRVALQHQLRPDQIAHTMGALLALTSVAGVVVQATLTTAILERWGVGLALSVLPLLVALLVGLYLPVPLLGLIAGAFFVDKTLRPNLHRPAESCLLAALVPAARPTLLLALGSIVGPLLKAGGALLLWLATAGGRAVPDRVVLAAALVIAAGLALLSSRWGRLYARTLRETLEEGAVDLLGEGEGEGEALVPLIDGPRLQILLEAVTRGSPRSRELALEMLLPHRSDLVRRAMVALLSHPSAAVRVLALRWFARGADEESGDLLPHLQERWRQDPGPDADERAALLAAAGPLAPALLGEEVGRWLRSGELALRVAVVRALLRAGDGPSQAQARPALHALLTGAAEAERLAGLRLLAESGGPEWLPGLRELLATGTLPVRREVLGLLPRLVIRGGSAGAPPPSPGAAGRASPNLAPLWAALYDKDLGHAASRALASCGPAVLPQIAAGLADPSTPAPVRLHLLRALGLLRDPGGAPLLLDALGAASGREQLEALRGLDHLHRQALWQPDPPATQRIEACLLGTLRRGLRLRRAREALLPRRHRTSLVVRELAAQVDEAQQRCFRALCLLVPPQEMVAVYNALGSTSPWHRDQARELLRARLRGGPLCAGSLQLLSRQDGRDASEWDDACFRPPLDVFPERSPEIALRWLLETGDAWLRAALCHDPGWEVKNASPPEDPMKASLDILLFLKDVALFEALTNQQLAEVAKLAERVDVPAGVALFQQGDLPDYLYLVRRGKLVVLAFGQEVARLGPGECAGEMAVLADIERTATVATAEPCQLLRFEASVFLDLLDSFPEIGRGLMRSLVRKLMVTGGPRSGIRPATITGMVLGNR